MKTEKLYRTDFRSEKEFKHAVKEYIEFYNEKRPHSVLRYRTHNKFEEEYINRQAALESIEYNNNGSFRKDFDVYSQNFTSFQKYVRLHKIKKSLEY